MFKNFDCSKCGKNQNYTNYANINNPKLISTSCISCQSESLLKDSEALQKQIDNETKFICTKCKGKRPKDQFIWTSKDGKRNKIIKTCFKCRNADKNRNNCKHDKLKSNCGLCKVLNEMRVVNIVA